ncbi:MAG TPA: hypothetical protein PKW90_20910, partial [Myxococcota bacterium]|nr:hypothetical protein [Myxococcota bacterium]
MTKALGILVTRGKLRRLGRSLHLVRSQPTSTAIQGILLVGASDEQGNLRMDSERELSFWREITHEAESCGLEVHRLPWTEGPISPPPRTRGLVVSTWHVPDGRDLLGQPFEHHGLARDQ